MASFKFDREFDKMKTNLAKMPESMRDTAKTLVTETVREGASIMQDNISRVETELMRGSVSYEPAQGKRHSVSGKFGWGLHNSKVEPYFIYQEQGFRHYMSGKDIPPMHALLRAFMVVRERFYSRVHQAVNK